jgi:hypothetical protein
MKPVVTAPRPNIRPAPKPGTITPAQQTLASPTTQLGSPLHPAEQRRLQH